MAKSKVNSLRKTLKFKRQGILKLSVKECLKELQEKYVFVLANIIIVICKHYYLEVICKELSFWPGTESGDTYIAEVMDLNEIIGNRISYVKCLGFKENNLSDKFPSFY